MLLDFATALRLTELLLAIALIQQSLEHVFGVKKERGWFLIRLVLAILLLGGLFTNIVVLLLLIHVVLMLKHFKGPYNGGSDRMTILILTCVTLIHYAPWKTVQEYILGYLALQTVLSYFSPGFFKLINPEWLKGKVLVKLLKYSGFPASENLRIWALKPSLLFYASWLVLIFELAFPLTLLNQTALVLGLLCAVSFHLVNTYAFGFNRFFWAWLAAYPSLIWLQGVLAS